MKAECFWWKGIDIKGILIYNKNSGFTAAVNIVG